MPYARPTLTALRDAAISDIVSALPVGQGLLPVSVLRYVASAIAASGYDLAGLIDYYAQQNTPFSSSGEYLEAWAALKGVYRKGATAASGAVAMSGLPNTVIPAGSKFTRADGVAYVTTADQTIGSTTTNISLTAAVAGAAGNCATGVGFSLTSAISGITSSGTCAVAFVGGADIETDDAFRTRMLAIYGAPPTGGSATDYTNWALAVPGVTRAWCLPNGFGAGTVVVYVMMDIANAAQSGFPQGTGGGAALETRIPAATGDNLSVANYIYPLRPATAIVYAAAPTAYPVNVTISGLSPNTTAIRSAISSALAEVFYLQGSPLGSTLSPIFLSDLEAAVSAVPGVAHFTNLVVPTSLSFGPGLIPVLGNLVFS